MCRDDWEGEQPRRAHVVHPNVPVSKTGVVVVCNVRPLAVGGGGRAHG